MSFGGAPGIEPGTSRARSENHATRPSSHCDEQHLSRNTSSLPAIPLHLFGGPLRMCSHRVITNLRCSIVVSISACHAEDPGSIPGRGAACTDRAHHNGQLLMQPGLGQRVPCFWVCPPSSDFLGRRRWPQNRTKGQQARAERDGPRLAQICRSRLSCSLGLRAAVALMISRRAEPLRSGAATCGASPR